MKRYIELCDADASNKPIFMADWMTHLKEENDGEIYLEVEYKTFEHTDEDKEVQERKRIFKRFLGKYENSHKAIQRIREFQEKLE